MGNRIFLVSILEQALLIAVLVTIWLNSEMWGGSLWVNETDTLSYAEHGIEGFGYGYGAYVFILHILLSLFGEIDAIFRGLSLICSIITMLLIYQFSSTVYGRRSGVVSSFLFAYSSYSIEFGMQVRDYSVHSFILMCISFWLLKISKAEWGEKGEFGRAGLIASFGVWFVSVHWFCQIYLILLFCAFCIPYFLAKTGKLNQEIGNLPKSVIPPIITTICIIITQVLSMTEGLINSADGEHHLGGGSVPLVILPPMDFLIRLFSGSIFLILLVFTSTLMGVMKIRKEWTSGKVEFGSILIFSPLIIWTTLCFGQYHLHGLIVERYFYFWFPLVCVYSSAPISQIVVKIKENKSLNYYSKYALSYFAVLLILATSNIVPDSSVYGNMKGGFEMIDEELGGENFSIISRPPEHILDYYLRQLELEPEIIIGAWHSSDLDKEGIRNLETEFVVVISLQSGWILEETSQVLEETGYSLEEENIFYESGDTFWVWRK